jgi:V/A-type H+/Na+-transporting ATPase subunit I
MGVEGGALMAIVALVKVTFCGPAAEKDSVLDGLQQLGCVHLNDLRHNAGEASAPEPSYQDARQALQYLRDSPVRRRAPRQTGDVDLEGVVKEALELRDRSRALSEEREQLGKCIADLEPWGNFELPQWAKEGSLRFWFYIVPHHHMPRLDGIALPWKVVGRDHRFAYAVLVGGEQPTNMPVAPTALDPRSLAKTRRRLGQVECELEELDYRRIGLTIHAKALKEALQETDDRIARQRAATRTLDRDQLFAVEGWAPRGKAAAVRKFCAERQLALTLEPPGLGDNPPTLLSNPPTQRGGESLVEFYMTPAYRLWDPSQAVFFAFGLFFAMILSDAGYAAILGIALSALWRRMGRSESGRGLRHVMLALVIFSLAYGVLVGTYFGIEPPAGSWLASLHLLDANDQRLMMWIAIGVGAAHLIYANLASAWWRRHSPTAISALAWAVIILAGFCVGLATSYPAFASLTGTGLWTLGVGALLVLLFTSERPFSLAPGQVFGRFLDGIKGLTELSKAFGDVLSYLRLFALGLASIKLAEAFNGLAATAFASKGVGVLLGLLVLLVGHGINLAMGIMSGVVHSLRLNLIEFFNWSLPEEGERFQAFEKRAVTAEEQ